jgi:hypothetical protein
MPGMAGIVLVAAAVRAWIVDSRPHFRDGFCFLSFAWQWRAGSTRR